MLIDYKLERSVGGGGFKKLVFIIFEENMSRPYVCYCKTIEIVFKYIFLLQFISEVARRAV